MRLSVPSSRIDAQASTLRTTGAGVAVWQISVRKLAKGGAADGMLRILAVLAGGSKKNGHPQVPVAFAVAGLLQGLAERLERCVVIGFVLDFRNQLAVQYLVILVEDNHCPCRNAGEWAAGEGNPIILKEFTAAHR